MYVWITSCMDVIPYRNSCPVDDPGTKERTICLFFCSFACKCMLLNQKKNKKLKQLSQHGKLCSCLWRCHCHFICTDIYLLLQSYFKTVKRAKEGVGECKARAQVCAELCVCVPAYACMCVYIQLLGCCSLFCCKNLAVP